MKTLVTRKEMIEIIKTVRGSTFFKFVAETVVDMRKTGNPFVGATKVSTVAAQLGCDYETKVNNQLGREDKAMEFVVSPSPWQLHTDNKHFLTDKKTQSKLYLVVFPLKKSDERIAAEPTKYFFNGKEIERALLEEFFPKPSVPKNQGVENPVIYRSYGFDSFKSMTLMGTEYEIIPDASDPAPAPF